MIGRINLGRKLFLSLAFLTFSFAICNSQNTVGVIMHDASTYDGFTLYTIHNKTYLINNCGQVINQWTSEYPPGNAVYLLEDGSILRAGKTESQDITFGGVGGVIEKHSWEGELLWQYFYDTPEHRQHHDIYPMPNGTVLILAATVVSKADAIQLGRNPDNLTSDFILNERIIEVQPVGSSDGNIIWEWNFFDHLIQDFDSSKNNFGVVNNNPQLVDFNYIPGGGAGSFRWLHINSIQYYAEFDQIILSSRLLDEIYIIDHSTTTSEAAGHTEGRYGKGGDFLYRWGNPQIYGKGSEANRQLGGQHYAHFIEPGLLHEGKILLFNNYNNPARTESAALWLDVPQSSPGVFIYDEVNGYGPVSPSVSYTNGTDFFSAIIGSAQALPNGNTLMCEGASGEITEIDTDQNIVWSYIVPVDSGNGTILTQGQNASSVTNQTFRGIKYATNYSAFKGRDLTPGDPIELNSNTSACDNLGVEEFGISDVKIYPNPTTNVVNIQSSFPIDKIELFSTLGALVKVVIESNTIELNDVMSGIYFMSIHSKNEKTTKRIIKQ